MTSDKFEIYFFFWTICSFFYRLIQNYLENSTIKTISIILDETKNQKVSAESLKIFIYNIQDCIKRSFENEFKETNDNTSKKGYDYYIGLNETPPEDLYKFV